MLPITVRGGFNQAGGPMSSADSSKVDKQSVRSGSSGIGGSVGSGKSLGSPSGVVQETKQSFYERVTGSNAWRHSISRISCAARIPIYALATVLQTGKTILKSLAAFVVTPINRIVSREALDHWTFEGVAIDVFFINSFFSKTIKSIKATVTAPSKEYKSLAWAFGSSVSLLAGVSKPSVSEMDLVYTKVARRWAVVPSGSLGLSIA